MVLSTEERAALSQGASGGPIYDLVVAEVGAQRYPVVVDVGCGSAAIAERLRRTFERYIGCDAVRYDNFPDAPWSSFVKIDLNTLRYTLDDAMADLVLCIEAIEHAENPRALMRELVRIAKPGATIIVTTPNQLSLLSKLSLFTKNEFVAFQEAPGLYPAHITALVEADLRRIAVECGLDEVVIRYTNVGRVPFTKRHWPRSLGGRAFSDNVLMRATRR